jgi:predicted 3-demethylubiquinone-9 3-methyltransferase (glyoxalase superfamily)
VVAHWLKDKYGVMQELLERGDRACVDRVTQAFLKMKKFGIATLNRAAGG